MVPTAKVERALRTILDHHPERRGAIPGAGSDLAESCRPRGIGGCLPDRIAGQVRKSNDLLAAKSACVGAGQKDGIDFARFRSLPVDRAQMEERSDDGIKPHRRGASGGCVRAGLRPQDQEDGAHPEKRTRKEGAARSSI